MTPSALRTRFGGNINGVLLYFFVRLPHAASPPPLLPHERQTFPVETVFPKPWPDAVFIGERRAVRRSKTQIGRRTFFKRVALRSEAKLADHRARNARFQRPDRRPPPPVRKTIYVRVRSGTTRVHYSGTVRVRGPRRTTFTYRRHYDRFS